MAIDRTAMIFVHGILSSDRTWTRFRDLVVADPDYSKITTFAFDYPSPHLKFSPLRRIPDYDVVADSLRTYLETEIAAYPSIVLVSHSQGGLIVQRFLDRMVSAARGRELGRVRLVVMFACPNSGSELFILMRRLLRIWNHPQERALRPIDESVGASQRTVINRIIHAERTAPEQCRIPIVAYAGDRDNIVKPVSARGVFPDTGVLPGDHFTIIQPDSPRHRSYVALKHNVMNVLADEDLQTRGSSPRTEQALRPSPRIHTVLGAAEAGAGSDAAVLTRWNPVTRTYDFILSPDIAYEWFRRMREEGPGNDQS